jgi:hypothetical protein
MRKAKPKMVPLVGAEWALNVLREADGWRVEDATLISITGRVRTFVRHPFGDRRFPSRTDALLASTDWMGERGSARQAA